jgi:hypothetical protein
MVALKEPSCPLLLPGGNRDGSNTRKNESVRKPSNLEKFAPRIARHIGNEGFASVVLAVCGQTETRATLQRFVFRVKYLIINNVTHVPLFPSSTHISSLLFAIGMLNTLNSSANNAWHAKL